MRYTKFIQSWKELESFKEELLYFDVSRVFVYVAKVPAVLDVFIENEFSIASISGT